VPDGHRFLTEIYSHHYLLVTGHKDARKSVCWPGCLPSSGKLLERQGKGIEIGIEMRVRIGSTSCPVKCGSVWLVRVGPERCTQLVGPLRAFGAAGLHCRGCARDLGDETGGEFGVETGFRSLEEALDWGQFEAGRHHDADLHHMSLAVMARRRANTSCLRSQWR